VRVDHPLDGLGDARTEVRRVLDDVLEAILREGLPVRLQVRVVCGLQLFDRDVELGLPVVFGDAVLVGCARCIGEA
jgi:hypothetical protein